MTESPNGNDAGLASLVLMLRFHGIPADPGQIRREFGQPGKPFATPEILRSAKHLGLKARAIRAEWKRLVKLPLPLIAAGTDGGYLLVGKIDGERLPVQSVTTAQPNVISRAQFERRWTGELLLFTTRSSVAATSRKFDFSWFLPSIIRYRRFLGEVLIASFFIQLLALVTPLFFQVVIDKVLVHQGLTTLDVLAIGLLTVALFEVVLTGLRTYVFSHTTNRVDVELGSRLYRHLQRLPIAYFHARPVGSIVARVRELDSVRNFLTGSALTLVIDLSFTFVFLFVMYLYSPLLFKIVLGSIPFYVALAVIVTPILRRRLDEKFARNAECQSFLVESVSGAETVKSMSIEPEMQRSDPTRMGATWLSAMASKRGEPTPASTRMLSETNMCWSPVR